MSPRRNSPTRAEQIATPIALLAAKQRVGKEDSDAVALPLLIHFDAAKRGQGPAVGQQHLYLHLLIAQHLAAWLKNRPFYDATAAACDALMKASRRPTAMLDLATSEYQAIRKAFSYYLRVLPNVEVGMYARAGEEGARIMATTPNEAAA